MNLGGLSGLVGRRRGESLFEVLANGVAVQSLRAAPLLGERGRAVLHVPGQAAVEEADLLAVGRLAGLAAFFATADCQVYTRSAHLGDDVRNGGSSGGRDSTRIHRASSSGDPLTRSCALCYIICVARGSSGRIVVEIDPELKNELYIELARRNLTLKAWFIAVSEHLIASSRQPSLFVAEEDEAYAVPTARTKK